MNVRDIEEQISKLEKQKATLAGQLQQKKALLAKVSVTQASLKAKVSELSVERQTLQQRKIEKKADERLKHLDAKRNALEKNIENNKKSIDKLKVKVDHARCRLKESSEKQQQLKKKRAMVAGQAQQMQKKRSNLFDKKVKIESAKPRKWVYLVGTIEGALLAPRLVIKNGRLQPAHPYKGHHGFLQFLPGCKYESMYASEHKKFIQNKLISEARNKKESLLQNKKTLDSRRSNLVFKRNQKKIKKISPYAEARKSEAKTRAQVSVAVSILSQQHDFSGAINAAAYLANFEVGVLSLEQNTRHGSAAIIAAQKLRCNKAAIRYARVHSKMADFDDGNYDVGNNNDAYDDGGVDESAVAELDHDIAEVDGEVAEVEDQLHEINAEIANYQHEANLIDSELQHEAVEVAEATHQLDEVESEIKDVADELSQATDDLQHVDQEIEGAESVIEDSQAEVEAISNDIGQIEDQMNNEKEALEGVEEAVADIQDEMAADDAAIEQADEALNDAVEDQQQVDQQVDNINGEIEDVQSSLDHAEEELSQANDELQAEQEREEQEQAEQELAEQELAEQERQAEESLANEALGEHELEDSMFDTDARFTEMVDTFDPSLIDMNIDSDLFGERFQDDQYLDFDNVRATEMTDIFDPSVLDLEDDFNLHGEVLLDDECLGDGSGDQRDLFAPDEPALDGGIFSTGDDAPLCEQPVVTVADIDEVQVEEAGSASPMDGYATNPNGFWAQQPEVESVPPAEEVDHDFSSLIANGAEFVSDKLMDGAIDLAHGAGAIYTEVKENIEAVKDWGDGLIDQAKETFNMVEEELPTSSFQF